VHEEAFFHYLSFLTSPAPQTLFKGIQKIPCGCLLKVNSQGRINLERYWDVWDHTTPLIGFEEEEIAEMLLAELRTSVKLRKVSDVPVGVFLSGGIDSSTNAALFSEGEGEPVKTFTIGYKGEYQTYKNEMYYARKMADIIGARYHELLLTVDDLIEFLPHMVHLQDEPIADPVCFPVYYVSKLARENGVIVCQLGEGADELFCGYPGWKTCLSLQKLSDRWRLSAPKRLAASLLGTNHRLRNAARVEWMRRAGMGLPIFWSGAEAFTEMEKRRILHPRLQKEFDGYSSWEAVKPIRQRFEEKAWEKSNLPWMSYMDLNLRLPELLLMRVDKMSMGVSLEGRVPFLDHKFVELAMSVPERVKIANGELKYILKKAVSGVIPDELINREKQGFHVPVYEWFFDRLGDMACKNLDSFCQRTEFLDRREVSKLIEKRQWSLVWYLLNFSMWWERFIDNTHPC
jgi:asparagine synthase (glutamine-hydrolysing)